ncbi:MAG: hypothetical protein ACRYFX_06285 [Janthinobacterium lividum]
MWFETSFFGNPFSGEQYIRARKLLYAYDQIARFTALDAAAFAVRIQATQAAADDLSAAVSTTGAATGTQRGATSGTDTLLQAYRRVVGSKYTVLLDQENGNKNALLLLTVFGASIQRYTRDLTKTNAKERMDTLNQLLAANSKAVGPAIVKAIGDAATAYLGQRANQVTDKATTATAQLDESTQELALDQALWLNLGAVVAQYPAADQERQRHAAADFSVLQRRPAGAHAHTEAGALPPHAVLNLVDSGLLPTTALRLHNPGSGPLYFALSDALGTFPATGYQEMKPADTFTGTAADLGDPILHPYLNVQNPTNAPGTYEVKIG